MNIKTLRDAASYDIAQGIHLRRATDTEIEEIQKTVNIFPDPMPLNIALPKRWEHTWQPVQPGQHQLVLLPNEEWRYHVIAAPDPRQKELLDLIPALDLARTELEIGFTRIHEPQPELPPEIDQFIREHQSRIPNFVPGSLHGYHGPRYIQFMRRSSRPEHSFLEIGQDEAGEIAETLTLARESRDKAPLLKRHLKELSDLKGLTFESPLRFLGYFAVLESLLIATQKHLPDTGWISRRAGSPVLGDEAAAAFAFAGRAGRWGVCSGPISVTRVCQDLRVVLQRWPPFVIRSGRVGGVH